MERGQQMHAWWNQGEVMEVGMCSGGTKQKRANRSQYLEKRPLQPNAPPSILHRDMGVKAKTGNSTLTQKRANVNNQMNGTWPELQCERCLRLPFLWLHKHLLTGHPIYWACPPPPAVFLPSPSTPHTCRGVTGRESRQHLAFWWMKIAVTEATVRFLFPSCH